MRAPIDADAPNREEKRLTTHNRRGAKVITARCENEQAEAQFVCATIEGLVGTPFFSRSEERERPLRYGASRCSVVVAPKVPNITQRSASAVFRASLWEKSISSLRP